MSSPGLMEDSHRAQFQPLTDDLSTEALLAGLERQLKVRKYLNDTTPRVFLQVPSSSNIIG